MAPRRASLPMDPTLPAKDLRVRTPKVRAAPRALLGCRAAC